MVNNKILAIIKREIKERLMSKRFIYTTLAFPLIMFLIIGVQAALFGLGKSETKNILVVSNSEVLLNQLNSELKSNRKLKSNKFNLSFQLVDSAAITDFVNSKKKLLLKNKITGILFVPESALKNKNVMFYSKTSKNLSIQETLSRALNSALVDVYFSEKKVAEKDIKFARKSVGFTTYKVSEKNGIAEEGFGNLVLAYIFTFLLYISLLMIGQLTMQSVMEEKTSKVVEVILSSVNSRELMTGKIIGSAIIGLAQMTVWLSPIILLVTTTWFTLPKEITLSITLGQIVYFLINYFVGLILYLGLFATLGAIYDNVQDAQQGMWPIMMLIIIPFFIALAMMQNPNSAIANISSMVPFASIIVMPVKMTLSDVQIWNIVISLLLNVLTIFAIFPFAGKIYRVGILRTGKKPKLTEVIKWLKFKY